MSGPLYVNRVVVPIENYLVELVGIDKTNEIMHEIVVGKNGKDIAI